MNYTLQQLRYLVAVAEHGNVSAAARSLFVSQPGVSAAVSHLESTFGVQCFVRHHAKGVTLTAAGKSLVAAAKDVLKLAEELHQRANELNHSASVRIALGCCSALSNLFLPPVLEMLGAADPEVSLQIRIGDAESLHRWLHDGTIEVALMYDLNCDPVIYSKQHLTAFRPHVLLPASHPLAERASVSPGDVWDEPLILLDCAHSADYVLSLFQYIQKRPNIKHRVSSVELVQGLVSSGKGYAILNARPSLDRACQEPLLKWIPMQGENLSLPVILASMHMLKPSGQRSALVDACNAVIRKFDPEPRRLAS